MPKKAKQSKFANWWDEDDDYRGKGWGREVTEWAGNTSIAERQKIIEARKGAVRCRSNGSLPDIVTDTIQRHGRTTKQVSIGTEYAGYDVYTFAMDVNGSFHANTLDKNQGTIRSLHDVADKGFKDNALYAFERDVQAKLPSEAKRDAVKHYKFLRKFPRTDLCKMLLGACHGNADQATQMFFEAAGNNSNIDDLSELADMDHKQLKEVGVANGRSWGTHPSDGMKKFLDVRKLLRHIRKDWDFSGERTRQVRVAQHPADDIHFRQIHSLTELTRIGPENFADLNLLLAKIVQRNLIVREYDEWIPGPPKRFVILIDDSGSMTSTVNAKVNGEKFSGVHWAIAIGLAIVQAAEAVDNKVTLAMFDNGVHNEFTGNSREVEAWLWKQGFRGGGTDIHAALQWADRLHEKDPIEATVIITDGAGTEPTKPKMPLFTVYTVPRYEAERYQSGEALSKFSEKVIELSQVGKR